MSTSFASRARPNGWYGMLVLVATESAIFGALISTYVYLRFGSVDWPPAGIAPPSATAPIVLTAVLVATSLPLALAARTAWRRTAGPLLAPVALAVAVQAGYLAFQVHLYADDLSRFSPKDTAYGSIYFTLLAVHHAHVAVGILAELWLIGRLRRGMSEYRRTAVMAVALYWHFVNLAAIAVTTVLLSPSW